MHDVKNKEKEKTPAILALFPHTACTSGAGTRSGCLYFYGGYGKQVEELRQEAVRLVRQSDVNTFKANQTSIVYASDGSVISTLKGEKDSYYVSIEEMPVDVVTAIVSIEDKKFFRHHGMITAHCSVQ